MRALTVPVVRGHEPLAVAGSVHADSLVILAEAHGTLPRSVPGGTKAAMILRYARNQRGAREGDQGGTRAQNKALAPQPEGSPPPPYSQDIENRPQHQLMVMMEHLG